jgi:hypothetical protein
MGLLCFGLPLLIMTQFLALSWLSELREIAMWIWHAIWSGSREVFWTFILRKSALILSHLALPAIYTAAATTVFVAAKVRYALTGRIISFFTLFANVALTFRHLGGVLRCLFLSYVTFLGIGLLSAFLVVTGVGILIDVVLGAAYFWIVAYWEGDLATEMYDAGHIRLDR